MAPTTFFYVVDGAGKSVGVFRFHYTPGGGNRHGAMSAAVEVVGGASNGNSVCGIGVNTPATLPLGPDGTPRRFAGLKASLQTPCGS